MCGFIEDLVKKIVKHPEMVSITESEEYDYTRLFLHVAPDDWSLLLGEGGDIIQSLRTIVSVISAKDGRPILINVVKIK